MASIVGTGSLTMIKVNGREVTLTGTHAQQIQKLAKQLGKTPQEVFTKLMREFIKREKEKERLPATHAEEMEELSRGRR